MVMGVIRDRMRARGISSEPSYRKLLAGEQLGGAEWSAVIEQLLNHETSFFRHPSSFEALRTHILPELRDERPRGNRIDLWSAGCSTGQEAYSLAMMAMDDKDLGGEFTVWAGDISREAIEIARRGRYGLRAVASMPPEYRQRYLREVGDGAIAAYEVVDTLRRRVRFMAVNLAEADSFTLNHDVIFCHNVLIYFSPAVASQIVAQLAARLKRGGYLLLGPGEAPNERPPGLESVNVNGVRAFRRNSARPIEVRA